MQSHTKSDPRTGEFDLRSSEFDLQSCPLSGISLIEASAGTGKTYNIERLFLRLLLEPDAQGRRRTIAEILCVTFTRAAAAELRERIRNLLLKSLHLLSARDNSCEDDAFLQKYMRIENPSSDAYLPSLRIKVSSAILFLRKALDDFEEACICTIHAFCARVLYENPFASGMIANREPMANEDHLSREIARDYWRLKMYTADSDFFGYASERGFSPEYFFRILKLTRNGGQVSLYPYATDTESQTTNKQFKGSQEFIGIVKSVRSIWRDRGKSIISRLQTAASDGILKKNIYSESSLEKLRDAMDTFSLRQDGIPLILPQKNGNKDPFERLCSNHIAQSLLKSIKDNPIQDTFFDECQRLRDTAKTLAREMDFALTEMTAEFLDWSRTEQDRRKEQEGSLAHDDLLQCLLQTMHTEPGGAKMIRSVRKTYRAALIDEFQDTDAMQWDIFRSLFVGSGNPIFLIGDPKQSIYSFRGAELRAYIDAASKADFSYTLQVNHRSAEKTVQAVNTVFKRELPFFIPDIKFRPAVASGRADQNPLLLEGSPANGLIIWHLQSKHKNPLSLEVARSRIALKLIEEIETLLSLSSAKKALIAGRALAPADIAILVHTNREADLLQNELRRHNISASVMAEKNLFHCQETDLLTLLLETMKDPTDFYRIRALYASELIDANAIEIRKLNEDEGYCATVIDELNAFRSIYKTHGFMRMFMDFMHKKQVPARLLALENGERKLTNLFHLAEALHQEEKQHAHGSELRIIREKKRSIAAEHTMRLESDRSAIQIITSHLSKGLEFPIVFYPFPWSSFIPEDILVHNSQGGQTSRILIPHELHSFYSSIFSEPQERAKLESFFKQAEDESFAEKLRILYVALTRASHRSYISWGHISGIEKTAGAYCFHGESLKNSSDKLSAAAIYQDLQAIVQSSSQSITLSELEVPSESGIEMKAVQSLEAKTICLESDALRRTFSNRIIGGASISSYTSLMKIATDSNHHQERDAEASPIFSLGLNESFTRNAKQTAEMIIEAEKFKQKKREDPGPKNIFTMPSGARTGNFFHLILERYMRSKERNEAFLKTLTEEVAIIYGMQAWTDVACETIQKILRLPLLKDRPDFILNSIRTEDCVAEMDFLLLPESESSSIAKNTTSSTNVDGTNMRVADIQYTDVHDAITRLPAHIPEGYLQGFIDLIFRFEGRFYILDWKSNHLGTEANQYSQSSLDLNMKEASYDIQYYIYLLALDKYLRIKIQDYSYEKHIGGILYIYLRGAAGDFPSDAGIFYRRPTAADLQLFRRELNQRMSVTDAS